MYFTSGSDRAFEQLMQTRPGADHFDNGEAGAPEDCGTCRFYRPHWKYQFCVYEECPYQPGKLTALDGAVKFQVKGVDDEMAVFRVEKNRGYTVMSNHHLRNKDLSLKAKGLLSQMLSLPEDWDYTLAGLSFINREKIDAIREAVKELERAGYIVRSRERDEKGRLRGADYVIFEQPQPPTPDLPTKDSFTCLTDRLYTYFSDKNAARFPLLSPITRCEYKRSGLHFVHTFVTARCSGKIPASRSTRRFAPQRSSWYLPFPLFMRIDFPFQE